MGFLVKQCKPGTILSDPTQIGIEVAVPQLPGARRKKLVTKDVVIWNRPGMTCWSEDRLSTNHPLCIMEWKRGEDSIAARRDIDWLRAYSTTVEGLLGFSVVLGLGPDGPRLRCVCVNAGKIAKEWLIL
ncbi:MAG: hypothetical protein DCC63_14825 [Nitrospira sp.]|nr:MAG: hypothetical protein DCC63_14825 [Nitrospira sp.]